jgi:hypothetical protein
MAAKHISSKGTAAGPGPRIDALLGVGALALCAVVVAGFAWTSPTRAAKVLSYEQTGTLSYSAPTGADSLYGAAGVTSGQPVYSNVVQSLALSYNYAARSSADLRLTGSEHLVATVSDGLGATRSIAVQSRVSRFSGASTVAMGTLRMGELASATASLAQSAGSRAPQSYRVSVTPSISAHGLIDGHALEMRFDEPVNLVYTPGTSSGPASLAPAAAAQGSPPNGPTTLVSSAGGSVRIPGGEAAMLPLGLPVLAGRVGSILVVLVAGLLAMLMGRRLLADATSDDERVRIATRYASSLVEVAALPGPPDLVVVEMASFEGLLQVSKRLECPILHRREKGDVYAVVDSGTIYRYSLSTWPDSSPEGPNGSAPHPENDRTLLMPMISVR